MLFNSIPFLIFLPLVWAVYFLLPFRLRWVWMLGSSYFFYGYWKFEFVFLMAFTSLVDWYCGSQIKSSSDPRRRKLFLWFSILSNLLILFFFKYFNFFFGSSELAHWLYRQDAAAWAVELARYTIPAGISFYTFQSISYVVDVYRGHDEAERSLPRFMLFVSFFPQLVAGPIERFSNLQSQLFSPQKVTYENLRYGFRLLLYGLFLKICVADNLAAVADQFYGAHRIYSSAAAWTAAAAFCVQVYADFFGYSLMAQGAARLFGIDLMDNFLKPFLGRNIPEFWQRWHISLSTWFRDYLYIPLGGSRKGTSRMLGNVMLVFLVSGLWHGANWTMILFGAAQGVFYWLDYFFFKKAASAQGWYAAFSRVKTVFIFMLTLVFFRSVSLAQSTEVYRMLFSGAPGTAGLSIPAMTLFMVAMFLVLDLWFTKKRFDLWMDDFPWPARWLGYSTLCCLIWMFGGTVNHPFVYFQF
ncbi:MAG: MBOAT family protein [Bacteroidetes bacterium]|nr:MBOAT family protein [Bacteroidota bacterium]